MEKFEEFETVKMKNFISPTKIGIAMHRSENLSSLNTISNTIDMVNANKIVNVANNMISSSVMKSMQEIQKATSSMLKIALHNNVFEMINNISKSLSVFLNNNLSAYVVGISKQWKKSLLDIQDKFIFIEIADELGFPVYLEIGTELQDTLIAIYRSNGNKCDIPRMRQAIFEYCNGLYIDSILHRIKNSNVFKKDRISLIEEGVKVYQEGYYAASGALFITQISGMISDVHDEMLTFTGYTKREKEELLDLFEQQCKIDSEKGKLIQIVCKQDGGMMLWNSIMEYFLRVTYSSRTEDVYTQPKRNKICHGDQLNFNTKEMNLKILLCMDIISELGWRTRKLKENYIQ